MAVTKVELDPIDTSDIDRWLGKSIGGVQLKEPISVNDIRLWVQAMHNPNRLYYDTDFAAAGQYGGIVAPQSFAVCCTGGHGSRPAQQGTIPGCHMLFGGDEWWFHGPVIRPGDLVHVERIAVDFRVVDTKFAGPTVIQRGDNHYINQEGERIATQRSTAIRYLVSNAEKLKRDNPSPPAPVWTDDELLAFRRQTLDWCRTFAHHVRRRVDDVKVGDELARRVIGPHTATTLATEWRAFISHRWGATYDDGVPTTGIAGAGFVSEMLPNVEDIDLNPELADGLYYGPSRGHTLPRYANLVGVARGYGYGASMGAWVLDYVGNWAGELGRITHSKVDYRAPALVDDITVLSGKVTSIIGAHDSGAVTVDVAMTNQDGRSLARGQAEVTLAR